MIDLSIIYGVFRKISLSYLIFVSCLLWVHAQERFQKFYHLTRNAGLSQSTVNAILKDTTGYMWFATNDGLDRYDGYNFTIFKYNSNDKGSLGLGRTNTIFLDKDGKLWAGTDQGGLNLFIPEKDQFEKFQHSKKDPSSISDNNVRAIVETMDYCLWVGTSNGLNLFNPDEKKFISKIFIKDHLGINCLQFDQDHNLWIGTDAGVFMLPRGEEGLLKGMVPKEVKNLPEKTYFTIYCDSRGVMWFGTYGNGAFSYNPENNVVRHYGENEKPPYRLSHDIIRSIIECGRGVILFGTGGGGVDKLNLRTGKMIYWKSSMNNQYSLNSNIIYSFYTDDQHNLWIGTYNGGVNILFSTKDKFVHVKGFGGPNGLSNNAVLCLEEDKKGKIWIGTDGGGIDVFDPVNESFQNIVHDPNNPQTIGGNVVKSLFFDSRGMLWIGTFNAGLSLMDLATGRVKRYYYKKDDPNGITQNHIWDIDEDNKGNIWLATLGGGVDCYQWKRKKFIHYRNVPGDSESLSNDVVSCILIDSKGTVWAGTEFGGLNKLVDKEKGIFKVYKHHAKEPGSLSSNQICTLYEDSRHQLWIGTLGGGIDLYQPGTDSFRCITEGDGMASNIVYGFLEDDDNNLWISTNNGISKYIKGIEHKGKPTFINYDMSDGLQGNEFSPQSALKARNGLMYFGGLNGFNYFYPDSIVQNRHKPKVVLTDFRIFSKSATIHQKNSPLSKPISLTHKIVLGPKQSVFTIEFAALDYNIPDKNHYKYMLENFENQWNDVGNQRTATYTNLNPGTYIFKVMGSNNDGVWNTTPTTLEIVVQPPFYETWLFRIVLILFIFLIGYQIFKMNVKSLEKQQRKLKRLVDARTKELVDLNALLENQNHEIQQQREELLMQKESLINANLELEHNQKQIRQQNKELEKHRNNLEELVKQRTNELEQAKIKAEESDQLKMAFLSNMSHEIRTPMNAIIGFSSLLSDPEINKKEQEEFIRQINSNGESLLVLIDDILELSRIEANQLEIKFGSFDVSLFINDLYLNFQKIEENTIDFRLKNQLPPEYIIESDKHRLRQILINLLDNAFKFTNEGFIEISATFKDKAILFTVSDTGIGIEKKSLKVIFDRFRKGNDLGNKLYRGAGLGLTISRRLAELLGGVLWAESEPGKGSVFYLQIPDTAVKADKVETIGPEKKIDIESNKVDLSGKNILVVEDEINNYQYLERLLEKRNATIYWAKDGIEAVQLNRENHFDIILMDIKMPEMSGYDAIKFIKKETPEIPVIAQTAFARLDEKDKIEQAGFNDYILKPIKPAALMQIIVKYL